MSDLKKWIFCPICGGKTRLQSLEVSSLALFSYLSASPQFWESAKHRPFSQHRGYALRRNNNLLYEVSRPISRRPLLMSYTQNEQIQKIDKIPL